MDQWFDSVWHLCVWGETIPTGVLNCLCKLLCICSGNKCTLGNSPVRKQFVFRANHDLLLHPYKQTAVCACLPHQTGVWNWFVLQIRTQVQTMAFQSEGELKLCLYTKQEATTWIRAHGIGERRKETGYVLKTTSGNLRSWYCIICASGGFTLALVVHNLGGFYTGVRKATPTMNAGVGR